jgi:hypothetical protein
MWYEFGPQTIPTAFEGEGYYSRIRSNAYLFPTATYRLQIAYSIHFIYAASANAFTSYPKPRACI